MTFKSLSLLFTLAWLQLFAVNNEMTLQLHNMQTIDAITFYNGDTKGRFKNDPVAILSDSSAWKIHCKDQKKFGGWRADDIVNIDVRKWPYIFKREHKFLIRNHTRNQTVRAMILDYPQNSLIIVDAQKYFSYVPSAMGGVTIIEKKEVQLNDGSYWNLDKRFKNFTIGRNVYIGVRTNKDSVSYFLISGTGKDATWTWALRR